MSLEHSLERIAVALEALASSKAGANVAVPKLNSAPVAATKPAQVSTPAPATSATATPLVPSPTASVEATIPAPAGLIVPSPEECNNLLMVEYVRLGENPEVMQRILGVMESQFAVRSVMDLTKEQYGPLITMVRELK